MCNSSTEAVGKLALVGTVQGQNWSRKRCKGCAESLPRVLNTQLTSAVAIHLHAHCIVSTAEVYAIYMSHSTGPVSRLLLDCIINLIWRRVLASSHDAVLLQASPCSAMHSNDY
jgi:hypothetical protein